MATRISISGSCSNSIALAVAWMAVFLYGDASVPNPPLCNSTCLGSFTSAAHLGPPMGDSTHPHWHRTCSLGLLARTPVMIHLGVSRGAWVRWGVHARCSHTDVDCRSRILWVRIRVWSARHSTGFGGRSPVAMPQFARAPGAACLRAVGTALVGSDVGAGLGAHWPGQHSSRIERDADRRTSFSSQASAENPHIAWLCSLHRPGHATPCGGTRVCSVSVRGHFCSALGRIELMPCSGAGELRLDILCAVLVSTSEGGMGVASRSRLAFSCAASHFEEQRRLVKRRSVSEACCFGAQCVCGRSLVLGSLQRHAS